MFGQTALVVAIRAGHIETVARLLEVPSLNVNIRDIEGRTALMHAAILGNSDIFKLLLERQDVDVNLQDNYGHTALTYALNGMKLSLRHQQKTD